MSSLQRRDPAKNDDLNSLGCFSKVGGLCSEDLILLWRPGFNPWHQSLTQGVVVCCYEGPSTYGITLLTQGWGFVVI
jgi:hypothetical protein